MQTDIVDVLVVGGGLSGLAVAFGLQRAGALVEVLDERTRAGGVIGSLRRDGSLYETGPNSALDTTPLIDELLDALGIRGERVDANAVAAQRFIVRNGRLVRLPSSPPALLGTAAFSLRAKLRLLREPFIAPAPSGAEESVAGFVRRRLGPEILDYAVDPFVSGVYAGNPDEMSIAAAFPRLHALEQEHGSLIRGLIGAARQHSGGPDRKRRAGSFSFRGGMQTLTDALARALRRVESGVHVQRVGPGAEATWSVTATRGGETLVRRARAVVLAAPSYEAAALVREFAPAAASGLSAIEYAPIASIATAYGRADISDPLAGFGFLVPKVEQRRILGSLFSSSMFDGRAPAGTVLLTTFVGGRRAPGLVAMSDAELGALVHDELAALVGARNAPTWTAITRWSHAIPQYNLGHRERLRTLDAAERAMPGLFFCANYRGGVAVGERIRSADATATAIAGFLGAR